MTSQPARTLSAYFDDPGATLPDAISDNEAARQIAERHETTGGATFHLYFGDLSGQNFYAVSIFPDAEIGRLIGRRNIPETALRAFLRRHRALLSDPRCCLGTWFDVESGVTFLDISVVLPSLDEALALGKRYNQKAIFDLRAQVEIDAGGTGEPPEEMPPPAERLPDSGKFKL